MAERLRLSVRTPEALVLDAPIRSLRVPTDTGQVGLRPRAEPAALCVEPGLALVTSDAGLRFLATAGGLLRCDGQTVTILTPIAVVGASAAEVGAALEHALGAPTPDLELRRALERLETGLLRELRRDAREATAP